MPKKTTYNIAVTLPITLWLTVKASSRDEAIEKAKEKALNTPYEEWGDDFSNAELDIVED